MPSTWFFFYFGIPKLKPTKPTKWVNSTAASKGEEKDILPVCEDDISIQQTDAHLE